LAELSIYIGNEIGKCQSSARIVCGRFELDLGLKSATTTAPATHCCYCWPAAAGAHCKVICVLERGYAALV